MPLQAVPSLPPGTPWWGAVVAAIGLALINAIGLVLVARAQRKSVGEEGLVGRVKALEDSEPAELVKVREVAAKALEEAKDATESAERVAGDLKAHLESEQRRREVARRLAEERDRQLASKVDAFGEKVTTVSTQVSLILDGRVDTTGGPRRGR